MSELRFTPYRINKALKQKVKKIQQRVVLHLTELTRLSNTTARNMAIEAVLHLTELTRLSNTSDT